MKTGIKILLSFIVWGSFVEAQAQQKPSLDLFHDAGGNSYHQLFVDFHITELVDIKYATDPEPVDAELSVDGYSVIIKNYPGDKSVKLKVKDDSGTEKEVTKSRCFIDPVLLNL